MSIVSDFFRTKRARAGTAVALTAALALSLGLAPAFADQGQGRYDNPNTPTARYGDDQDRQDRYGRPNAAQLRREAMRNGYTTGFRQGQAARSSRRSSGYQRDETYRQGNSGYDQGWGSQNDYQRTFRQAFSKGYSDGYNRRAFNRGYSGSDDRRNWGNGQYGNGNGNYPNSNDGYNGNYGNNNGYNNNSVDDRDGDLDREEVAQRAARAGYDSGFERGQYDASKDRGRANPNPQGHGAYQHGLDGWNREWGWGATYQQVYRQYFVQGHSQAYAQRGKDFRYRRQ